jgi:hypothetical protein
MFSSQDGFNFNDLDLTGVKASAGVGVLPPGKYVVRTSKAEIGDTKKKDGSKQLSVLCTDVDGNGIITAYINVFNKTSEKATEIGREQLRALLEFGGHPSPDRPGDISTLNGLTVGIIVGRETYEGKTSSKVKGFCLPSEVQPSANGGEAAKPGSVGGDSDIPW